MRDDDEPPPIQIGDDGDESFQKGNSFVPLARDSCGIEVVFVGRKIDDFQCVKWADEKESS